MNIDHYYERFSNIIENYNPNNLGIYFSLLFHLLILLFAIGLPDIFKSKPIMLPNIVPIEIVNISDITSITNKEIRNSNQEAEKKIMEQKKFNASENLEIVKVEEQKKSDIKNKETPDIFLKKDSIILSKNEKIIKEKIMPNNLQEENFEMIEKNKSLDTSKIKPKIKPKIEENISNKMDTDMQINPKPETKPNKIKIEEAIDQINPKPETKPDKIKIEDTIDPTLRPKPQRDWSVASAYRDLLEDKSQNLMNEQNNKEKKENITNSLLDKNENQNTSLSISEIDLLRQQLSSCWNAPAGAVISKGMKVKISAKVQQNKKVIENSIRIVDTNIAKTNTFYGPITESAMRTLLKPECTPLKLPEDKFNLWKNLTITFDYSIMKGYSE